MTSPEALPIRIIDAVAAWVEDHADLPPHTMVPYRRAMFIEPKDCPVLNVFLATKAFGPSGTDGLNASNLIVCIWTEKSVKQLKMLKDDVAFAKSLITNTNSIELALHELFYRGWVVDEAWSVRPVSIDWQPPIDVSSGLVEGYSIGVQVDIIQRPRDLGLEV